LRRSYRRGQFIVFPHGFHDTSRHKDGQRFEPKAANTASLNIACSAFDVFVVQRVREEAMSSAFLLFSASAIASLSDPSRKDFNRGITEGQRLSAAKPQPKELNQ
jgi:hypothetical protein